MTFALDGVSYEIDLTAANAAELRDDLAVVDRPRPSAPAAAERPAAPASKGRGAQADLGAVREWARENGHQVSDRGRISAEVQAAYDKAHG